MGRSVTVTGRGRASAPYDVATLRLAVSARAANPSDATARASYAMQAMRDAVVRGGASEQSLATTSVSLNPVHDPWPTVVAYEASLSLSVRLTDLDHVGSVLVSAVQAGGDGARVEGITFSHDDSEGLEAAAREAAYENARAKAAQYAALAGQALGEVRQVVEAELGAGPSPTRMMAMAADSGGAAPIDGGEGTVGAVVTVTWALGAPV